MITLKSVIAGLAFVIRSAGIAYTAGQVIIWHSYYLADSWRLAAPAAAMTWAALVIAYLRQRQPAALFACMDSAVYVAFALSAEVFVPPGTRDHAFNWLVISISSQLIVPVWYAPAAMSAPLALASPAAYWVGAWQLAGTQTRATTATAILLATVAGSQLYGRRLLYGRAAAADAALDQADKAASEQYVILSRNIEEREQERLLHDTVLNTLTAVARASADDVARMVSRCHQDIALIQARLSDRGAADGQPPADLADGIAAVASQMRARGLAVHVEIAGNRVPAVPAPVATALSDATREALANVAAHAGTGEAWVEVSVSAPRQDAQAPLRVQVTVRDRGSGFDPARVDPARLGLRRSITERTADCGGQTSIWSMPGRGTVVRMSWPAPAEAAPAEAAPAAAWPPAAPGPPW